MRQILKTLLLVNIIFFGLLSCSSEEMDEKNKKISLEVRPEEPNVYDFDYKYEDDTQEVVTLSKNYFQAEVRIENKNTEYGLVIVGFIIEATSSSEKGGIKVDNQTYGPVDANYLASIAPGSTQSIILNIGNLNPNATGLSYSVKLTAKGYFSEKSDPNQQLFRFSREYFFTANGSD